MTNPLHTHTTELDITVAGVTKTHMLVITYTISEAVPAKVVHGSGGLEAYPAEPLSVEIHEDNIRVLVERRIKGELVWPESMKIDCLSPIHLDAIEREILEGLE